MTTQLSTQQLMDLYPNNAQRRKLFQLYSLRTFLSGCLIESKYRVTDGLHTPIVLTKYGERIADRLRKGGVPFHESRLLCFLEMLGPEPLIDVDRTDLAALESCINSLVRSKEIVFPFRFGRQLYDRFNNLYDRERGSLSAKETWDLLMDTPQGVYQVDDYVSGPYGILKSRAHRAIYPSIRIPLQHCTDSSCRKVHEVILTTDYDAPINAHRTKISKMLERDGSSYEQWDSFFESFASKSSRISESNGEPYITLIGDALTDSEMRKLLSYLLDSTKGTLRETVRTLGLKGKGDDIANPLGRAEVLQLACTVDDSDLISALDHLVASKKIDIPEGETRTAVVNSGSAYGPYRVSAELNRLGVRLQAQLTNVAPLRLRQMVDKMYNLNEEGERDELLWQLRAKSDETVERRLQRHLQTESPRSVIERLTLARRSNVIVASEYLHFAEKEPPSDEELIDTIMWKLGFPVDTFPDINADLFSLHDKILLAIRQNDSDPSGLFYDDLSSLCHKYWVKLEEVLHDSLCYATWALTVDHVSSQRPYSYKAESDGKLALKSLNADPGASSGEHDVIFGDRPTLYALCRGFERLAFKLAGILGDKSKLYRDPSTYPKWTKGETLQLFPFDHKVPFLDLATDSQEHILERLREISRLLVGSDAAELRNAVAHPRLSHADSEQLRSALESIREAMSHLEADGFCRMMYTLENFEGDSMARQKIILSHRRGYMHALHLPSSYSWIGFPSSKTPQYVMSAAKIKDGAEVIRFARRVESPYAKMYEDYPRRPLSANREIHSTAQENVDM